MPRLSEAAPAKVNLFLHVTGRRADGYHLLDSVAVFAGAADVVHAEPDVGLHLELEGPFGPALAGEADNLVLRAARLLARHARVVPDVRLILEKHLPVASGIGGGSADAAATLRLLARYWNLDIPRGELARLGARLGADVPVCLTPRPTRMGGIGDVLGEAPVPPRCGILLVNPGVALATAEVFRARTGPFSPPDALLPEAWLSARSMAMDLGRLRNDLEPAAISLCPAVGEVLAAIRASAGNLLARMSGSGATCFGIYPDAEWARRAAEALRRPGWWSWGGELARA
jgi:4-diphosphocytidyl-2-C-methyl-D-erythritol kinase